MLVYQRVYKKNMWKLRVSGNYNHTLMIGNYYYSYYSLMPIPYYNYIPDYKHDANIGPL